MARYDIDYLKSIAAGRWPDLLGIEAEFLDRSREHPCPKCGGNTRFRALKDFEQTGAVYCSHCFSRGNGDGIAAYAWFHDCTIGKAISDLAEALGVQPEVGSSSRSGSSAAKRKPGKGASVAPRAQQAASGGQDGKPPKRPAEEQFRWSTWSDQIAAIFATRKGGIQAPSLVAVGARLGNHFGVPVVALPLRDESGGTIGYVAANAIGGRITINYPSGESETTSWKNVIDAGRKGICATANLFVEAERAGLTRIFKTEGPSDLLAIIPFLQPGEGAFCNPAGANENPINFPWLAKWLAGKSVAVIHDRDAAGESGAMGDAERGRLGWATWAAKHAAEARKVDLPYPMAESKGADFRQWVIDGGGADEFTTLVAEARVIANESPRIIETDDDPHRLARINMEKYKKSYGRRLVYWQSEWYRWKSGKYIKIEVDELKAKVSNAVRAEFELLWPDKLDRYNEWKASDKYNEATDKGPPPIQKVTRNLVSNVIGAMEGMAAIPGSIKMPCWLPDRSNRRYVSMGNGILDIDKVCAGKPMEEFLLPHSSDWFSTFQLQYDYSKTSQCPKWLEYIDYVMDGDRDRIAILQEWAGYLLTPTNDLQKFLVLEGEGQNGKTVYFSAIRAMLGEENISNVPLENFGGQFDLESTLGKAANISGDTEELDRVSEGALKKFTGGDTMQFDRKNIKQISARPSAKLMCAWNKRPHFKDRSRGLWRRMILVPFDRFIPEEKRVLGMDKPEWWLESGEVPGILRWAIIGLDRLNENRRFTSSDVSEREITDYQRETNPAREFLLDSCDIDESDQIECAWLYKLYHTWAISNGNRPLANNSFGKEVARIFPSAKRERVAYAVDRSRPWVYIGLKFTVDKICEHSVFENYA